MALALLKAPNIPMPAHVYRVHRRACPNPWKDRYTTAAEAHRVVTDILTRNKHTKKNRIPQGVYECRCGGFHLSDARRVVALGG
ncbi:hypothetical protein SSEA_SKINNY_138 [Mycobacterium phage Skinny]|uniref:Uncharacterized protein n=2 Tax=Bongovirus bongo TaxID=1983750 RepID=A0A514DJB8_9CAUD|nr:hypothetical protein PEGLEG_135 [Mycobacterium phage PegLeg]QDH93688.1 hypothetical protein SEA_LILHOMIEP_132 [Mycobacterium phage LilhomieP]QUU29316.1 hypothetical protein [Mycobacterium phage SirSheldon]UXE05309.1 hypothetical protein SSEA_SKINNY_138 [Mycobacterium phage Skinny]WNN95691.1 hypothetical protein SEA_GLASKE16_134 [Mycobacterium phage Glaske16]WNN96261.1 hypothetical protein SEA_DULCITA_132 [Mycobacterium phage Dulcita]WNO28205.1 hypothetical protein SEA_DIMINIMUS_132 [Mycoba